MVLVAAALILAGCAAAELATEPVEQAAPPAPPPPPPRRGVYKIGKPYKVAGNWYYPKVNYGYQESGVASWYGPNFQLRPTANGELFDMRKVSAAHKTLPLPSIARVTNLENGRSLVLRVNDRGPFVRGRIIDLSKRAAELLGFAEAGTAMVRVELLAEESRRAAIGSGAEGMPGFGPKPPEASPSIAVIVENLEPEAGMAPTGRYPGAVDAPPVRVVSAGPAKKSTAMAPPPFDAMTGARGGIPDRPAGATGDRPMDFSAPADSAAAARGRGEDVVVVALVKQSRIFIQAGAFARFGNANRLRARLSTLGPAVNINQVYVTNQPMFRVRIGPLSSVDEADETLERVIRFGYPEARIIVD
ncbi:MAG: septal ring lytic transglycosylase RlpA family protein [Alphaproteobacteria bacterium]